MSGWHPDQVDGGLLPNSADPHNPAQAFSPVNPALGTSPNYYGNGCDVRLRPAVLNSLISENLSTVDSVGLNYNPNSLINLRTAIEYIEQKSLPEFCVLSAQGVPTNYYSGALSPPLLGGYNNGMTLVVVPNSTNQGFVRVDLGGGHWAPVLRNDHAELEADDWPAWVPQLIGYYNGAFFQVGLAKSQVPIVLKGAISFWIRPDGNDVTGDGSENDPSKAFRTIDGAWGAVGSRFSASPSSHIAFRLGVPGDYEGGTIGPYGATVSMTGDVNNAPAYRIHAKNKGGGNTSCVSASGVNAFYLTGVACVMDLAVQTPYYNRGLDCSRSSVTVNNVDITLAVDHPFQSEMLTVEQQSMFVDVAGWIGQPSSTLRFIGNGHSVERVMRWEISSSMLDHAPAFFTPPVWSFENIKIRDAGISLSNFCTVHHAMRQWVQTGCTGRQYVVTNTSNLTLAGRAPPGDQDGAIGPFSTVTP